MHFYSVLPHMGIIYTSNDVVTFSKYLNFLHKPFSGSEESFIILAFLAAKKQL